MEVFSEESSEVCHSVPAAGNSRCSGVDLRFRPNEDELYAVLRVADRRNNGKEPFAGRSPEFQSTSAKIRVFANISLEDGRLRL